MDSWNTASKSLHIVLVMYSYPHIGFTSRKRLVPGIIYVFAPYQSSDCKLVISVSGLILQACNHNRNISGFLHGDHAQVFSINL